MSIDPDDLYDSESVGIEYVWDCYRNTFPNVGDPCWRDEDVYLMQPERWKIEMTERVLQPGQYVFTLNISQGSIYRRSSMQVNIRRQLSLTRRIVQI